eukprot:COSAG02_NODE_3366_length_6865_cov_21.795300_2_plen_333_part_00
MANSGREANRILMLQAKQEEKKKQDEEARKKVHEENTVRIGSIDSQFEAKSSNADDILVQNTVGLVSLADYKKTKSLIEANIAETELQEESRKRGVDEGGKKKKKKKKRKVAASKLSFGDEVEEEEAAAAEAPPKVRLGKNPTVDTTYLPDRERAEEERLQRVMLKREWIAKQDQMKDEPLEITYSYWDGHGHRKSCVMRQGSTIDTFLREVQKEFPELRGTSSSDLMYIKEDLIIPNDYTFYDLIVTKARGKSGPLFSFDVHDDVRTLADVRIEKNESHAGKVVERRWYERNKHIFPASRWEIYDPNKEYGDYTIHGGEVYDRNGKIGADL